MSTEKNTTPTSITAVPARKTSRAAVATAPDLDNAAPAMKNMLTTNTSTAV